jgi:Carboxypeptidase regulatory-like domain
MARRVRCVVLAIVVLCSCSLSAFAQAAREARLIVTIVDQTGAVIPAATVTVIGLEEATKKTTAAPVKSSDKGIATIEHLAPGRYSVQGEFPGFELGLLRDLRLKAGDNKHLMVLPLAGIAEEVTVGRDKQAVASDRASAFGSALTREQMESLSDDPDEMRRQLQNMAGPDATIRVDSFEGQELPPKAQIKAVHITRDAFAAENHSSYGMFIDIITQPGMGPLRGQGRIGFYDSALDGRNPLVPKKGPAETRTFGLSVGGTVVKDKSSFSVSVQGTDSYRTPNLYAATPGGTQAVNLDLRTSWDYLFVSGMFDYALTKDQTLRLSANRYSVSNGNMGVGAYDLIERAFTTSNTAYYVRAQEAGPLGRRFFINTRFALNWSDSASRSATEAPTVIVTDAFTAGGAQVKGGRYTRTFTLASDLDYVRGRHSVRGGIQFDGGRYRSDSASNYLGTYTFESLAAYEAGRPSVYTRRIGDPNIAYWNLQAGLYAQDDIRVRKGLTLSPGVRIEAQTHLRDPLDVGPRFGATWSPFKTGKTTLRLSWGVFYDWLSSGTFEQTLRVDGVRQQELNIVNPTYPDPGPVGTVPPTSRYLLGADVRMARTLRTSAGIDQQLTRLLRVGATFADTRTSGLLTGVNLNAPIAGVRPDPTTVNVIEADSLGRSHAQTLGVNAYLNFAPTAPGAAPSGVGLAGKKDPRFRWRRGLTMSAYYNLARADNNTDGAFNVSPTGTLETEWGPSSSDVRHRLGFWVNSLALKNFNANISVSATSGTPYTIRTGLDNNGDSIFNDRPAGIGRNTVRTRWHYDSWAYFTYTIGVGKRTVPLPPGFTFTSSGGGMSLTSFAQPDAPRYRVAFIASVSNLTNHANYIDYSGVMTSPFFLKPTAVDGVRSVTLSMSVSF